MPVKLGEREYRAMALLTPPTEERQKLIESDYYVDGYMTTFNQPYPLWGEWREQVDPHAFEGADVSDVIFQYDHEGMVLARNRNATLILKPDDHGGFIAADLSKSEQGRQLHEAIDNGLVDRMSFAFIVAEEDVDYDAKLRTIVRFKKIYDVSAVSIPANDATSISARSFTDGVIERERRRERARRRLLLRTRPEEPQRGEGHGPSH